MAALLPRLVDEALLPKAATRMASATQTSVIIGPAPGGLLYTTSLLSGCACSPNFSRLIVFKAPRNSRGQINL
jgi:hypothetical protein